MGVSGSGQSLSCLVIYCEGNLWVELGGVFRNSEGAELLRCFHILLRWELLKKAGILGF